MNKIANAVGLYCKTCQDYVDVHHAYLENGKLYVQGDCPNCGESIRFSADVLLISLMSDPKLKGNGRVQ